jgi:hypothetical protein
MASPPRKPRAKSTRKTSTAPAKPATTGKGDEAPPEYAVQSNLLDQVLPLSDGTGSEELQVEGSARAIEAIAGETAASDSVNTREATALTLAVQADVIEAGDAIHQGDEQPLTDAERRRFADLEREVRESFFRAGLALREIRDSRLYRETHRTFEEYCFEVLGYKRAYSYELLDAATTFDNIHKCLRDADILPTSAYQIRPLKKLANDPEKQADAWMQAVEQCGGKQPTYEAVKAVVADLLPPQIPSAQRSRPKDEQWKHTPTKTIRVPMQFADDLLKIAHFLDNGGSPLEIGDLGN